MPVPRLRRLHRLAAWAALAVLALLVPACGSKDKSTPLAPEITVVPAAWEGVWSVRTMVKICNTTAWLVDTTVVDTICGGTSMDEGLGFGELGFCENGVVRGTQTSVSYTCTDTFNEGGCVGTFSLNLDGTFLASTGTFTTTGRLVLDSNPNTGECVDVCLDILLQGRRLDQDPACPAVTHALGRALASRRVADLLQR